MFIVSNGAFKSGSTWLYRIAKEIASPKPIARRFLNPKWTHPSVQAELFEQFLSDEDVATVNYLSKNHVRTAEARAALLSHEHVRVLNITRDLRDVLVSAYFHDRREGRATGDIDAYWRDLGKKRVAQVMEHHRLWNTGHSQVFVTSYEALQASFDAQVHALAAFLGVEEFDVEEVRAETDFDRLRSKAKAVDPFHRKGIVGDWQNQLSPRIVAELAEVAGAPDDGRTEGAGVAAGKPARPAAAEAKS